MMGHVLKEKGDNDARVQNINDYDMKSFAHLDKWHVLFRFHPHHNVGYTGNSPNLQVYKLRKLVFTLNMKHGQHQ